MQMYSILPWFALLLIGRNSAADVFNLKTETFGGTPAGFNGSHTTQEDVVSFKGIRFAERPDRFQAPKNIESWESLDSGGNYDATKAREGCIDNTGSKGIPGLAEDCLYLDIYMPIKDGSKAYDNLVVFFWIHGGSWMNGGKNQFSLKFWATEKWHGDTYAVGVAVNYRLNILGFPDFNGMENGQKNLGTLDNIQALRFVNAHIKDFSGDPNQVTIFGESAGSMQVIGLWVSPDAKGLFNRAISQSPYTWSYENGQATPTMTRKAKMEHMEECMQCAMNRRCQNTTQPCTYQTPTIDDMTNCSCFGRWFGPVSDRGVTFPDDFYRNHVCKEDLPDEVPLLIGFNALEINYWTTTGKFPTKREHMKDWIKHFGEEWDADCVFQKLGNLYGDTGLMQNPAQPTHFWGTQMQIPNYSAKDIYATSGMFFNMISSNLMFAPNVYMYMFNESVTPFGNLGMSPMCDAPLGAHACEVYLVTTFMNIPVNKKNLQENMRKVWKQFATSGEPGWDTKEVGVFTGGSIKHYDSAFHPAIKEMLHRIMCDPHGIPECSELTCGHVKTLYKQNKCCGSPEQPFDTHMKK